MNQEEKVLKFFKERGIKVSDAITSIGVSRQSFYNKIRKVPLESAFKKKLESLFGFKLEDEEFVTMAEHAALKARYEELTKQHEWLKELLSSKF